MRADDVLDLREVLGPLARCIVAGFPSPWYDDGRGLGESGEMTPQKMDGASSLLFLFHFYY